MRLYAIEILYKDAASGKVTHLSSTQDLSSFGFFQRSSVKEFMDFTCRIISERTSTGARASVKEQEYLCHIHVRSDSLVGVLIADHEYPQRVGHSFIDKVLDEFTVIHPSPKWPRAAEGSLEFPQGAQLLTKWQNPRESDALSRVQADIDETKIVLHNTIEAVLARGEKLDDLVAKSEDLSGQSKAFYKTAKKTNSCCIIL